MDFLSFTRATEQFVYELMTWVLFFPLTIVKIILNPLNAVDYVDVEDSKPQDTAYASAMRPALLLLIAITIGSMAVPFTPEQIASLSKLRIGRIITDSWVNLVLFRLITFSTFPTIAALLFDRFTPGKIDRFSLRTPFSQQCYLISPFVLFVSRALAHSLSQQIDWVTVTIIVSHLWLIFAETLFFVKRANFSWLTGVAASLFVVSFGWIFVFVAFYLLS